MEQQSPYAVVMIRPHHFCVNPQTAKDNTFQTNFDQKGAAQTKAQAYNEVSQAVNTLRSHGVKVHLFEDCDQETPDSVFPNNWFSTHDNDTIALYPMFCENRRKENKPEILAELARDYHVNHSVDYSVLAQKKFFLEGTGSEGSPRN